MRNAEIENTVAKTWVRALAGPQPVAPILFGVAAESGVDPLWSSGRALERTFRGVFIGNAPGSQQSLWDRA
jgi:hypothetical protein